MELTAGPIRCKFADGELRYLYVGNREVVRRIYFAVRDGSWNTAMPRFTKQTVQQNKDGFTIDLAADCKTETADYSWTGHIEGKSDGTITFQASGAANRAFRSNRIGLCVLYGTPTVNGRIFETIGVDDGRHSQPFPEFVSAKLVAPNFKTLRYEDEGAPVTTEVRGDAHFDMEDQRTYSDSSFKAYAPLGYDYKQDIPVGARLTETVTVRAAGGLGVSGVAGGTPDKDFLTVRILDAAPSRAVMPTITQAPADAKPGLFGDVNGKADQHKGASALTWGFNPAVHLPDTDTLFENLASLTDQVRSAHAYAPGAAITLSPVILGQPGKWPNAYVHGGEDPLQGAWSAALVYQAALAGVKEVAFGLGPGAGRTIQETLAAFAGRPLYPVTLAGGHLPTPLDAFEIEDDHGKRTLWLVNRTPTKQRAMLNGSKKAVDLAPYEVRQIKDAK